MGNSWIDEIAASQNDPNILLNRLKKIGQCLPYGDYMNEFTDDGGLFKGGREFSGHSREGVALSYQCDCCGEILPLAPTCLNRNFPNNGADWKVEIAGIQASLKYGEKLSFVEKNDQYFKAYILNFHADCLGLWRKSHRVVGYKFIALLKCLKCDNVSVVQVETFGLTTPTCKRLWSVKIDVIRRLWQLDKNLWREYIWPRPYDADYFTGGRIVKS